MTNLLDSTPEGRAALAEAMERRRQQVRAAARRGEPRERWGFTSDALAELFTAAELAELETVAAAGRQAELEARRARQQRAAVEDLADRILREWDQQRREQARAEARRRLGVDGGDS